jgi:multicomponent K+:H+ antiporter subunit E
MIRRLLPHPILTVVLAVVWVLLANSAAPGQWVVGLLLGWGIPLFTLRFWPDAVRIRHPLTLLRFILVVFYDIMVANLTVAWLVLKGPRALSPAFVAIPLEIRSELAISLLANTICLTPGTLSAQLSEDHSELLVHGLNVGDADALVHTIKQRYEAPLKEVFES